MKRVRDIAEILGVMLLFIGMAIVMPWDMPKEEKEPADISTPAVAVKVSSSGETLKKMQALKYAATPPRPTIKVEPTVATWTVDEAVDVDAGHYENMITALTEEYEAYADGPTYTYIGTYQVTAYEWTGNPCANGRYPTEGYTIACNSLPLGTEVYLEGIGFRTVEDRGADWHASNWIDLYLGDVSACYAWGVQAIDVYIVE